MKRLISRSASVTYGIIALLSVAIALLSGCHGGGSKSAMAEVPKPHVPLPLDLAKCRPNELGDIPILEYHWITPPGHKTTGLQYPVDDFRADMERLYELGYRPINLSDYVHGKIDVPAGMSPFIVTFDDAMRGQIDFDADGNLVPDCAAGILVDMHNKYPDWPLKGTFFVLPMKGTEEYFYDRHHSQAKLQWLASNGFELGNHTLNHAMGMNHFTDERVQMEFAKGAALIEKYVPGYNVDTLALPYGVYPRNHSLVRSGQSGGLSYFNICAMKAAGGPEHSPADTSFEPYDLKRILPGDGNWRLGYWLNIMQHNSKLYPKYISDGDPLVVTVPDEEKGRVALDRLAKEGLQLRTYADPPG